MDSSMTERRFPDLTDRLDIHPSAYISPHAYVHGTVAIGPDSSVWPMVVIRGDKGVITIGARTNVQDGSILHVGSSRLAGGDGIPCIVGEECSVGHGVILHACTVGRRCLIGMGAILMDGAVLGDEVIVGAGALVTPGTKLPSRTLWVGSPARLRRALDAKEIAFLAESAAHYVELKNEYLGK